MLWAVRRGSVESPARSPDLTSLNFFLWRNLKSEVYSTKITNLRGATKNCSGMPIGDPPHLECKGCL